MKCIYSVPCGLFLIVTFLVQGEALKGLPTLTHALKLINNNNNNNNNISRQDSIIIEAATSSPLATTTQRPIMQGPTLPCACADGHCGCCTGYILDRFNQKICMNLSYIPEEFAVSALMTHNGNVIFRNYFSGRFPPPICAPLPQIPFLTFCAKFSDIYFTNGDMHICLDMEANFEQTTLVRFSFNCLQMGASGVHVIGPGGTGSVDGIGEPAPVDEIYDDELQKNDVFSKNFSPHEVKIIFASNLKKVVTGSDKKLQVKRLSNGDFFVKVR